MIILHGSYLPQTTGFLSRFVIWGESLDQSTPRATRKRGPKTGTSHSALQTAKSPLRTQLHPFAATRDEMINAMAGWVPDLNTEETAIVTQLPTIAGRPSASRQSTIDLEPCNEPPVLERWTVPAVGLAPAGALSLLVRVPAQEHLRASVVIGGDMAFWRAAARFVLELLAAERFKPELVARDGAVRAVWQPLLESGDDRAR